MQQLLCPATIGRDAQLAALTEARETATSGRGGLLVLLGEAGVGKSRLLRHVREDARRDGATVLEGRAVPSHRGAARRALIEALQSGLRGGGPPADPSLTPFLPALGELHPGWSRAGAEPQDAVVVAEALVRLLSVLGRAGGCVLLLEDLHWADPETLDALEYLADHLDTEPVLVVGTVRTGETPAVDDRVRRLVARRAATRVELDRLGGHDLDKMLAACLAVEEVDPRLARFVRDRAEGIPLHVEELLAALVGLGALEREGRGWSVSPRLETTAAIPVTFAQTVEVRLTGLPPRTREVLRHAAVFGRRFDWTLVAASTSLEHEVVLTCLREAIDTQLVEADDDGFRFRHALGRDAVLAQLLPPEQADIAARCASVLAAARPGLPGVWSEVAAELALQAGDPAGAVQNLLETARRALELGAAGTAAEVARRAHRLAGDDAVLALAVDEVAGEAAALVGDIEEASGLLGEVLGTLARDETQSPRRARLHLALARAAVAAGRWPLADHHVRAGTTLARSASDEIQLATAHALGSQVALAEGDVDQAQQRARQAVEHGERGGAPSAVCEAQEVLGRCARLHDLPAAEEHFHAARRTAERHGLGLWRARALHELGTIDLFTTLRTDRLLEARRAATEAGAVSIAALADLHLTSMALAQWRWEEAFESIHRCLELARPMRLDTYAMAVIHLACAHAAAGDAGAMESAIEEAAAASDDLDVVVGIPGRARFMLAMHRADLTGARARLDEAMALLDRAPEARFLPFTGTWALLTTVEADDAGRSACQRAAEAPGGTYDFIAWHLRVADAVACGRAGQTDLAGGHWDAAEAEAPPVVTKGPWRAFAQLAISPAAAATGWGTPADWLREALVAFEERGLALLASACRARLRELGVVAPRATDRAVPASLRMQGVTPREAEVLGLVADGLTNREVAETLHLSIRTVDRHVANLLVKTGSENRRVLRRLVVGDGRG